MSELVSDNEPSTSKQELQHGDREYYKKLSVPNSPQANTHVKYAVNK